MLERESIVINTGPILALVAALGELSLLRELYDQVIVPREVMCELMAKGSDGFGAPEVLEARWLAVGDEDVSLSGVLGRALDVGEAAVIQTAMDRGVRRVCIDEALGRRMARLHGLSVTGSLGVLLSGIRHRHAIDLGNCIEKMRRRGVWISARTEQHAIRLAGGLGNDQ